MSEADLVQWQNPYESYAPTLVGDYPPGSDVGRAVRRGDARLRLGEMDQAEAGIAAEERRIAELPNSLDRLNQRHILDQHYLVRFGCRADERRAYRELLAAIGVDGSLSLFEAAMLARMIREQSAAMQRILMRNPSAADVIPPDPDGKLPSEIWMLD